MSHFTAVPGCFGRIRIHIYYEERSTPDPHMKKDRRRIYIGRKVGSGFDLNIQIQIPLKSFITQSYKQALISHV